MGKLRASFRKEIRLLLSDTVGLLLIFLLPMFLVFVITIVQDSAFRMVNDNKISLLIVNKDRGPLGDSLDQMITRTGNFNIQRAKSIPLSKLSNETLRRGNLLSLYIPEDFTKRLTTKSKQIAQLMLQEFGLNEGEAVKVVPNENASIRFVYDPVLQESHQVSITYSFQSLISALESDHLLRQLYQEFGYDEIPQEILDQLGGNASNIIPQPAMRGDSTVLPNSTQHNVPAWSIFAMFLMVVALGGNVVKERVSGSFVRLRTIPGAFRLTLISKFLVFTLVAMIQLILMFSVGLFIFPLINLPALNLPATLPLVFFSLLAAISAISFSLVIGTYSKTQEQASGIGAVSVIIFAAIGGIWVPNFVMPEYLQMIGKISPLHWCIEGYYVLFLKNGAWADLMVPSVFLIMFILACQLLTWLKLKKDNFI